MLGFRLLLKVSNTVLWKNLSELVAIANLKKIILSLLLYNFCILCSFRNNRIQGIVGAQALADCLKHCTNMKELE